MEYQLANGNINGVSQLQDSSLMQGMNGVDHPMAPIEVAEPPLDLLERELPVVYDGQVPLGELVSRVVQAIYAEISELAETLPNMSDAARKRTLVEWVVKIKKQVVKLYAVARWARDADAVQKCMNITAFLMNQNQQFTNVIQALDHGKQSLDSARLRNHDLLTSLDVLTFGTYLRLPSGIKKSVIPPTPLTDEEVRSTMSEMEDVIRYRLRMFEIIPQQMAQYRIANGRVYFTAPKLFEMSLCLCGARKEDGWFFVHVEFLFNIGGDPTGMLEFPRVPTGIVKTHITDEANARLAFYIPPPPVEELPPGVVPPPTRTPPEGTVDSPLIRMFNFFQMMSLSYQLEVLWYQAEQMRALGWADYLKVEMTNNRKTLLVSYWLRNDTSKKQQAAFKAKLPSMGGTLEISIVEADATAKSRHDPGKRHKSRVLFDLQQKAKLGGLKPSDDVEELTFNVSWKAMKGVLGVNIPAVESEMLNGTLAVNVDDLDFESILKQVTTKHTTAILQAILFQLVHGPTHLVFSSPEILSLTETDGHSALQVQLCPDEVAIVTIDSRTGQLNLRETGDFGAAGRGPRFQALTNSLNNNPTGLPGALAGLRITTITELVTLKANSLGLTSYRTRNIRRDELLKLGPDTRGLVYIQLTNFPQHYLVVIICDDDFRYALITVQPATRAMFSHLIIEDIAMLNSNRLHEDNLAQSQNLASAFGSSPSDAMKSTKFNLSTQLLRQLYGACCARVAFMNVESQFKRRAIPFTHVDVAPESHPLAADPHIQSSISRSIPALCVQSEHILAGKPAAEAAMPNIRVIPLNWWGPKKIQVVTLVKLKYVQLPMGKTTVGSTIIKPSKRIMYDTTEAVVSFVSESVDTCVDEFVDEWARVSKIVVIAREVSQMAKDMKWADVKLLSFDLQTVEFAYSGDYTVSVSCTGELSLDGGSFDLAFSRCKHEGGKDDASADEDGDSYNPHDEAEFFLRNILVNGHGRLAPSLRQLVSVLRDTLPIVIEMDRVRNQTPSGGVEVDIFPKAAGWYRILYGDIKYALDFRLLADHRIAITDGSYYLGRLPGQKSIVDEEEHNLVGLQPIPNFKILVFSAIKSVFAIKREDHKQLDNITLIDVGVLCDTANVREVGRAIHEKVFEQLKSS